MKKIRIVILDDLETYSLKGYLVDVNEFELDSLIMEETKVKYLEGIENRLMPVHLSRVPISLNRILVLEDVETWAENGFTLDVTELELEQIINGDINISDFGNRLKSIYTGN